MNAAGLGRKKISCRPNKYNNTMRGRQDVEINFCSLGNIWPCLVRLARFDGSQHTLLRTSRWLFSSTDTLDNLGIQTSN